MILASGEKKETKINSITHSNAMSESSLDVANSGNGGTIQLKESLETNLEKPPRTGIGSPRDMRERKRIQKRMDRQYRKDMKHRDQALHNAFDYKKVKYDFETGKELSDGQKEFYANHPVIAHEKAKEILRGRNTSTGKAENDKHLSNFIDRQPGESFSYSIEFERYDGNKQDGLKIIDKSYADFAVSQLLDKIKEKGGPHSRIEIVPNVDFPTGTVDVTLMRGLLWRRGMEIRKLILAQSKLDPKKISINVNKSTFDQTTEVMFNLTY